VPMRRLRFAMLAVLIALAAAPGAQAQAWPQRPVKIVVPYAPGGITDEVARFAAPSRRGAMIAADMPLWAEAVRIAGIAAR
jgi:tripartite-type tricarboxylate transporter receptor subunit TctC